MARVQIQNVQVSRVISQRGFVAVESYKTRTGETRQTKYTVWVDSAADIPGEGALVTVSGNLSVRLEKFTNEEGNEVQYAAIHVNQPKIQMVDEPRNQPQVAPEVAQVPNSWVELSAPDAPF